MPKSNISIFAEKLVRLVRDPAIQACNISLEPRGRGPQSEKWKAILENTNLEDVKNIIVPDCVDSAIFYLLDAIDNDHIRLLFVAPDGQVVDLNDEGMWEMAGRYAEEDDEGWRLRYSKEKIPMYIRNREG